MVAFLLPAFLKEKEICESVGGQGKGSNAKRENNDLQFCILVKFLFIFVE